MEIAAAAARDVLRIGVRQRCSCEGLETRSPRPHVTRALSAQPLRPMQLFLVSNSTLASRPRRRETGAVPPRRIDRRCCSYARPHPYSILIRGTGGGLIRARFYVVFSV